LYVAKTAGLELLREGGVAGKKKHRGREFGRSDPGLCKAGILIHREQQSVKGDERGRRCLYRN